MFLFALGMTQTYLLVAANAGGAFPHLCSYQQWLQRAHALTPIIGRLVLESAANAGPSLFLHLMDSKPIPLCHPLRHGRVRLLRLMGAWFEKTKKGWFFGFKLHAIVDQRGIIVGALLTPANTDDRDPPLALAWTVAGGLRLGRLGLSRQERARVAD